MSLRIDERCVQCGACEWECPTSAIHPGPARPAIDPSACTECWGHYADSQCAIVCPTGAIGFRLFEPEDTLEQRYRAQEPDRAPTDTWVWRRHTPSA